MEKRDNSDHFFGSEWKTGHPLIAQLEKRLSRPVTFGIDRNHQVKEFWRGQAPLTCDAATDAWLRLRGTRSAGRRSGSIGLARARRMITQAIAMHLEIEDLWPRLKEPGDWPEIPALVRRFGELPASAPWRGKGRELVKTRYLEVLLRMPADVSHALPSTLEKGVPALSQMAA